MQRGIPPRQRHLARACFCCGCSDLVAMQLIICSTAMGVNGLWPILSQAVQRRLLLEFAAEGFRSGPGGLGLLKIGVDASTWMHLVCLVFRYHHAGAGQNSELRTLFYRLAAISVIPAHVVFVFDGPE
ncbi:hypothetical protein BS17DRAFT_195771 [Gyrodon lividus]|nr:hypothetical protein BS17DRAFT_195771 [Gyrodon lividus]